MSGQGNRGVRNNILMLLHPACSVQHPERELHTCIAIDHRTPVIEPDTTCPRATAPGVCPVPAGTVTPTPRGSAGKRTTVLRPVTATRGRIPCPCTAHSHRCFHTEHTNYKEFAIFALWRPVKLPYCLPASSPYTVSGCVHIDVKITKNFLDNPTLKPIILRHRTALALTYIEC